MGFLCLMTWHCPACLFLNGKKHKLLRFLCVQDFKTIDKEKILNEYDVFDHNYSIVEIFRYDPKLLTQGNYIDVISLYAQFKDDKDERVQIEIENLVNEILYLTLPTAKAEGFSVQRV